MRNEQIQAEFTCRENGLSYYGEIQIQAHPEAHIKAAELLKKIAAPGTQIIDIASGEGALAQRLLDMGFSVTCTTWNGKLKVKPDHAFRLNLDEPFSPSNIGATYRCAVAVEIIEHLENPSCFLRSLRSIVEDGGYVVLSTPNVESTIARLQTLWRGYPNDFASDEVRNNRHISILSSQNLDFLCELAGFEIVEKHHVAKPKARSSIPLQILKQLLLKALSSLIRNPQEGLCRVYLLRAIEPKDLGVDSFY